MRDKEGSYIFRVRLLLGFVLSVEQLIYAAPVGVIALLVVEVHPLIRWRLPHIRYHRYQTSSLSIYHGGLLNTTTNLQFTYLNVL
jgi:hypothetical protein